MTEADSADTYEQRARAIQLASQPILEGFERWLKQAGWREQTIHDHVDNIRFFTKYLAWYTRSQHSLEEATDSDVYWFLADWFPRKALWASVVSCIKNDRRARIFSIAINAKQGATPPVIIIRTILRGAGCRRILANAFHK